MRPPAADRRRPVWGDGAVVLLVAAAAVALLFLLRPAEGGALTASVVLDGETVAEYDLSALDGPVTLTPEGRRYASLVWRAHRALRIFLESDLGVPPETADSEACLMEHVLSEDTMERLIGYLEGQGIVVPE